MKQIRVYSIKVWLTSVLVSFILTQPLVYFFFHDRFSMAGNSYGALFVETGLEWLKALAFLIIPWLLIFSCVKLLFKPEWSLSDFKWVILFVSEFLTLFFLLDSISIFNASLLMPTSILLGVFAISNAVSVFIYDVKPIYISLLDRVKQSE